MAAASTTTSVKTDTIRNDKTRFQTQIVDGKPQIFFDTIDESSIRSKAKRPSRAVNAIQTNRGLNDQQKFKGNNQKGNKQQHAANERIPPNADGSHLGVYMTMDELSELVKAVKENAKNESHDHRESKDPPPAPALPPPPPPPAHLQHLQQHQVPSPPPVPQLDLQSAAPPHPPTTKSSGQVSPRDQALSIMAEKKRQKWLRERAEIERMQMQIEYDQLKHQLSPRHKSNSVSPERSTFQYDFPPAGKPPVTNYVPPIVKSTEPRPEVTIKINDESSSDLMKTRLMEKKQQQWKQENAEKMPEWNPFGRPGGGAPVPVDNSARPSQVSTNNVAPYRPPLPAQRADQSSLSSPPSFVHSDQTHLPAAMRTNLMFGDVRFEEDVKTAKELDRRRWLEDLQRQVEDNKRKNFIPVETTRRQDFLHENVQPLIQQAANRQQQKDSTNNPSTQDMNKFHRPETMLQQVYDRTHETDPKSTTTGEKLFGPNYETSSKQNFNGRHDSSHLHVGLDQQQAYRPSDARRDESVNTVNTTFRSNQNGPNEYRRPPTKQGLNYTYDESDLPPYPRQQNSHNRTLPTQKGKRNDRLRSVEETPEARRTSMNTLRANTRTDGMTSQMSGQRQNQPPLDAHQRPLWNYRNLQQREYVPNSKRDPHYEKRQRMKHFEAGNFDRIDDVQKQMSYNRWNSDSELQQQQKKQTSTNRVRSTVTKGNNFTHHKDESILNLLKGRNAQQDAFMHSKPSTHHPTKYDHEDERSIRESPIEKYENHQSEDEQDPLKNYSPSPRSQDPTPHKQLPETNQYDNHQELTWGNPNRPETIIQPATQRDHILQQLSAIKENMVRRQRELATTNIIPV